MMGQEEAGSWFSPSREPETHYFAGDGPFPNSALPLLVYRDACAHDPAAIMREFAANHWSNAWQNGIFAFDHFHSIAHEALGIARGSVTVRFGGPSGRTLTVRAGDVVVIPAGVGHRNMGQTADLLVVGAYPAGADYDTRRGEPGELEDVERNIAAVPLPDHESVLGSTGPLMRFWAVEP